MSRGPESYGMDTDRLVLIDPDMSRRAALTRVILDMGVHVEPFEHAMEFSERPIGAAIVLCADEGRALSTLANARAISLNAFSLIAYREKPDTRDVVNAMRMGADDYLEWPIMAQSLEYRLKSLAKVHEITAPLNHRIMDTKARIALLTDREREVMQKITHGLSAKETGRDLGISPRTVEIHRANVAVKMKAKNAAHLVRMFTEYDFDQQLRQHRHA
ncbi:response regulator transcription factor [Qipengyuania sp.]|uniref:response regulator transcription factor n=1 Tax=Qipengyuania sp. TaxID=2004515 RepID=UPI0035C801F7